jgi:hypothetical protein
MQAVSIPAQKKAKPVAIIFDSDMGRDYYDVGASPRSMSVQKNECQVVAHATIQIIKSGI